MMCDISWGTYRSASEIPAFPFQEWSLSWSPVFRSPTYWNHYKDGYKGASVQYAAGKSIVPKSRDNPLTGMHLERSGNCLWALLEPQPDAETDCCSSQYFLHDFRTSVFFDTMFTVVGTSRQWLRKIECYQFPRIICYFRHLFRGQCFRIRLVFKYEIERGDC